MSSQTASAIAWRVSPGRGVLVLPAVLGPQLLGRGRVASAEQAQRLPVGRVDLAAVHRQPGRGDTALVWRAVRCGRRSRRRRPAGTGGGRPAPRSTRPGRRRPRPGRPRLRAVGVWEISSSTTTVPAASGPLARSMRSRAIVRASRPAPASSATALAVVATATTGRPSAGRGLGGGVQHGRLAVTGRGEHSPQAAALLGQHPDRRHLVLPQPGRRPQRRLQRGA